MDFSGIIHKIRNGIDDVGSFFTGEPAHGAPNPAPLPQPQQPQFHVPQQQFGPGQQFRMTPPTSAPFQTQPTSNPATSLPGQTIQQPKPVPPQPNFLTKAWDQVNPFDGGRTFTNPNPNQNNPFPNVDQGVQQTINNSTHLNPFQKQHMLQSLNTTNSQVKPFNPLTATAESIGGAVNDVLVKPIANTFTGTIVEPARATIASITGNQAAENAANQRGYQDLQQSVPGMFAMPVLNAAKYTAGALMAPYAQSQAQQSADYARKIMNDHTGDPIHDSAVDAYANQVQSNLLNQYMYDTAGIDMNTPKMQTALHLASPFVQTAALAAGGVANEGGTAVASKLADLGAPKIASQTAGRIAGGLPVGYGFDVGANMDNPNNKGAHYLKPGIGTALAVGFPVAGAAFKIAAPAIANAASDAIKTNAPLAVQKLHNIIQNLPGSTRSIAMGAASQDKPVQTLPASSLVPNDMSAYGDLDPNRVEYYKQQIQNGQQLDPILAMQGNDGRLYIEDGKHRFAAMQASGIQDIPTKIVTPADIKRIAEGGYVGRAPSPDAVNEDNAATGIPTASDAVAAGKPAESPNHQSGPSTNNTTPQASKYLDTMVHDYADMLRSMDSGTRGGVTVEDNSGYGAPTYYRTSEHTPFYSDFYAQNGRAPRPADYIDMARSQLESGHADPYLQGDYNEIKNNAGYYESLFNSQPGAEPTPEEIATSAKQEAQSVGATPRTASPQEIAKGIGILPSEGEKMAAEPPKPTARIAAVDREAQNILQNGGTPDEAADVYVQRGKDYGDALREVSRVAQESGIDLGTQDAAHNPLYQQVALPEAKGWKQAVLNSDAVTKNVADLHNNVMEQAKNISQHDLELLDRTRNEPIEKLALDAKDPEQFTRVAAAAKNLNDYTQELGRMTGQNVSYRPSYGARMFYDLTDPESAKAYEAYKASLKSRPGYGERRGISSYDEAAGLGIKRAHANYLEDLMHDAVSRGNDLSKLTLAKGLKEAYPDQVKVGEIGKTPEGTYEQLRIPHGQDISMPKAIADDINHRAQYTYQNGGMGRMLRGYDTFNGATKFFKLALGGFHNVVEMSAFTARSLLHGDFSGIAKNVDTIFRKGAFDREMTRFQTDGTLEKAHFAGLTTGAKDITADAGSKVRIIERGKYNPIRAFHDALFQRQIPYAKLRIFADETKGLDLHNTEDVANMRLTAKALNDAFGGINRLVDGLTPVQSKMLSRAVLALDYNEGQARSLFNALTKGGPEGRIARQVVIGRMVLLAVPGIVAYSVQPGHSTNPSDFAKRIIEQVLDPHVPSPFKTTSGIPKEIELPVNFGGKLERAAAPFFDQNQPDKFSGVKQELSGNLASGPSDISQVATNSDYYGNPIITKDANTGKPNVVQSGSNLLSLFEPISGGQVQKAITGQESPAEAAVNTIGGRTKANPDDPRMQIISNRTKVVNGLTSQDQSALLGTHPSWGNLPKDQQNAIYANPHYEEQKWDAMLSNQNVYDALKKQDAFAAQHGQPANPLFSLNPNDAKTIMTYEWLKHADPGSDANNTAAVIYNENQPLIQKFEQGYANYGQQMNQLYQQTGGLKGDNAPVLQTGGSPDYHPDQATQDLVNQYFALTDPKQRTQFMNDNPQINSYFEALFQAENQVRASLHEPLLKDYPQAAQPTQNFMNQYTAANKTSRASLRNANPQLYKNMQSYMEQIDEYNVAKYAGQAQFQGQGFNQSALKGIYGLGNYNMMLNPDGTYALTGSTGVKPGATAVGGSSGSSSSESKRKATNYIRYRPHLRGLQTPHKPYIRTLKQERKLEKGNAGYRIVPEGRFTGVAAAKGIKNIKAPKGIGIKMYKVV